MRAAERWSGSLTAGVSATTNLFDSWAGSTPSDCQAGLTAGVRATMHYFFMVRA